MVLKLYYFSASPPSRAVLLTIKALKLQHELEIVNIYALEQHKEDYLQKNPQHTVPTMEDGDFILWDSHAINAYLVNAYAKGSSLYPENPKERAIVDQRLHFEGSIIFTEGRRVMLKIKNGLKVLEEEDVNVFEKNYEFVEKFLSKGTKYIAGDDITIADFSYAPILTQLQLFVKTTKYPLLTSYLKRCEETIPSFQEVNNEGLATVKQIMSTLNFPLLE